MQLGLSVKISSDILQYAKQREGLQEKRKFLKLHAHTIQMHLRDCGYMNVMGYMI